MPRYRDAGSVKTSIHTFFVDVSLDYARPRTFRNVSYGSVRFFVMFTRKFVTFYVIRQFLLALRTLNCNPVLRY
jgi:hypothetical protein